MAAAVAGLFVKKPHVGDAAKVPRQPSYMCRWDRPCCHRSDTALTHDLDGAGSGSGDADDGSTGDSICGHGSTRRLYRRCSLHGVGSSAGACMPYVIEGSCVWLWCSPVD